MPTTKQKIVIGKILENPSKSLYFSMRAAGYAHNTAIAPTKNLLGRQSFKDLAEAAGLTELFLIDALVADVKAKPGKRHKEIELGFKVLGTLQPSDAPGASQYNTFIQNNRMDPSAPTARALAEKTLEILMQQTKRKVIPNES